MRRITVLFFLLAFLSAPVPAREYAVYGPQGGLSMALTLPQNFDPDSDRCPMVILMHGIFSSKDYNPMPYLARKLAEVGIASIRFDFNGHGRSEGRYRSDAVQRGICPNLWRTLGIDNHRR
ncbi:MAG: hypothetical protein K5910_05080 [Bacteroidales bacterium]|nr:hypothetical protein [Bacteroidales bacterium]